MEDWQVRQRRDEQEKREREREKREVEQQKRDRERDQRDRERAKQEVQQQRDQERRERDRDRENREQRFQQAEENEHRELIDIYAKLDSAIVNQMCSYIDFLKESAESELFYAALAGCIEAHMWFKKHSSDIHDPFVTLNSHL